MKKCNKCNEYKSFEEFYKRASNKDGLRRWCKVCENESSKKWNQNNKTHIKSYNKKYKQNHKEEIKIYFEKNKDNIAQKRRESAPEMKGYFKQRFQTLKSNKEFQEKRKKWRENFKKKNPKYHNIYSKKRRDTDPEFRLTCSLKNYFYLSFKNNYKTGSIVDFLGMPILEFKLYLESKFEDWMNWDNKGLYNGEFNFGWDIDHIKPLSSFDFSKKEDIKEAWHYTNLQPLCSKVNRYIKKNNY